MLTCKQLTELVTDYLEGRLPLTKRVRFRLHVLTCPHCRTYLRQMRLTVRTLGKLPAEPIPPEVFEALMHQFRNWRADRS